MSFGIKEQFGYGNRPWSSNRRTMTGTLIVINVAVFILQIATGDLNDPRPLGWLSHVFGLSRDGIFGGYIWQPFTYMFLHAGMFHIFANMLVIFFAGRQLEQMWGSKRLLTLYFAGGLVGGIGQVLLTGGSVVGASAAGYALLIAFTTVLPETRITLLLMFVIPVRLKAKHLAYGAIGISLLFTLFPSGDNIGHLAHLLGCLVGWVYARQLGYGRGPLFGKATSAVPTHPMRPVQRMRPSPRPQPQPRQPRSSGQYISDEIDPILDKISRDGIHSLTPEERQTLERGREKIISKVGGKS